MTPHRVQPLLDDGDLQLYHGDALTVLRTLPAGIAQTCVTSPPYWGLRDYGAEGQLGLEASPAEYIRNMVRIFLEVRRVLRDDGTLWLNLGDSYASAWACDRRNLVGQGSLENGKRDARPNRLTGGLKEKDLVGIPWRVALALQGNGWTLRSDIIWSKPNPMPESVTDRPTKAHEYVFLFSKQPRYFYDADAIREEFEARPQQRLTATKDQPLGEARRKAGVEQGNPQGGTHSSRFETQENALICACVEDGCGQAWEEGDCGCRCHDDIEEGLDSTPQRFADSFGRSAGRNRRSVWTIPTEPFPEAHFATYPQALVAPCILAGTSERGGCVECGAPWRRVTERTAMSESCALANGPKRQLREDMGLQRRKTSGLSPSRVTGMPVGPDIQTTGWEPSCDHPYYKDASVSERTVRPQLVLDPFLGSGTTALVARKHGRRCIGIDLSAEYLAIAAKRTQQLSLLGGVA